MYVHSIWPGVDMSVDVATKRQKEKEIVRLMISIYCHGKHGTHEELCRDCHDLLEYTFTRIDQCPFMETKSFCSACDVHCYSPEMREKIRGVMRFSGPRMFLHHPVVATRHLLTTLLKSSTR